MTSDLCEEDVVQITAPQIISADAPGSPASGPAGGAACAAGSAARVQASSAAVDLGRRLLLAARAGDTPAVLDLMAKGAPFTTDWLGTSPLHLAAANGHVDTCAVLLRAGVTRDSRTKVERTPLHLAAHAGHADAVALLLDHGAIVDCRDMLRMTPLHWAAVRGHAAAACALLRRGADVRARCKFRHTPRALALRHRHAELAALLHRAELHQAAAPPPPHPSAEQTSEEPRKTLGIENLTKTPEIKIEKPKLKNYTQLKQPKDEPEFEQPQPQPQSAAAGSEAAAQLLRKHGITLLPADDGSTVLNAIQSGRTVVLSDAGKLMLKESGGEGAGAAPPAAHSPGGVVLRATPVRAPPRGVKVYSVNHKLLLPAAPAAGPASPAGPAPVAKLPVRKLINPQDLQQVKVVQLSSEALRARARPRRSPVKIIMNKSNFTRLMAGAHPAPPAPLAVTPATAAASASAVDDHVIPAPAEGERGAEGGAEESRRLRAQLAAAREQLAAATAELRTLRARLALYEPAARREPH